MKYKFDINLNKSRDTWNWQDARLNPTFQGFSWRSQLSGSFLTFFDNISKISDKAARAEIKTFLDDIYRKNGTFYKEKQEKIADEFVTKFIPACEWIEKVTDKPLYFKSYKIYLTTFPRCPYDSINGSFYFNVYNNENLVNTFMHEVLHFQFIHYWRDNPKSPVSKLSENDFDYLKESLTVIIDDDAAPPADSAEMGYIQKHHEFRKKIHKNWIINHNFDMLVEYSLEILPEFIEKK